MVGNPKSSGGVKSRFTPQMSNDQFTNFILRGTPDLDPVEGEIDFEESEEKTTLGAKQSKKKESTSKAKIVHTWYEIENVSFSDLAMDNNSVDLLITDIPYNVRFLNLISNI